MLSQDLSLATGAHELVGEGEEAIQASQQKVRVALRGIEATSDISETGSVDFSVPHDVPAAGRVPVGQNVQLAASHVGRRPLTLAEPGNEMADLIRCLSGAQANDSGLPVFTIKYVEYPRFRKEWWAHRRMYHRHVRDELVSQALKEKHLSGSCEEHGHQHRRFAGDLGHPGHLF
jgi:hypothetical protein